MSVRSWFVWFLILFVLVALVLVLPQSVVFALSALLFGVWLWRPRRSEG